MLTVVIKSETGITINNLPSEVLSLCESQNINNNGDLTIITDCGVGHIVDLLGRHGFPGLNMISTSPATWVICAETAEDLEDVHDDSIRREEESAISERIGYMNITEEEFSVGARGIACAEDQRLLETIRGRQPLPHAVQVLDGALQGAGTPNSARSTLDQLQEADRMIEELAATRTRLLAVAEHERLADEARQASQNVDGVRYSLFNAPYTAKAKCEPGREKSLIAMSFQNDLTSSATLVAEKVREINKLMSRLAILNNELKVHMEPIEQNPLIVSVIDQVNTLNESASNPNSPIESAYIGDDGKIVIITKNLQTEVLGDNTVRNLGSMEIVLNSRAVFSEAAATAATPVEIRNLTVFAKDSHNRSWQCGHAFISDGGDSNVCFGGAIDPILRSLLEKNIAFFAELLIRFIKNPNINDAWGKFIRCFPIVSESV